MLEKLKQAATTVRSKTAKSTMPVSTGQYMVALDVGTEFVKALIAKVTDDGAEIIGVGRAHQGLSDMQAGAVSDISSVVANCDAALNQAEQQAGVTAKSVIIGIAGELVKGTTTTVIFKRKESGKPMDMAEMEHIISLTQKRAEAKAREQVTWELGGKEVELKLVNSALVGIVIDGYAVTNPIGFQGKEVRVQLYTAFAPLIHIGALERVAEQLDLDLLAVAAEPFAVARSVIGNDASTNMSAILVDVGGGTTDIAVVNEGGVEGTKMFGIGGRAYTKSIARDLGVDFDDAEILKLHVASERIGEKKLEAVKAALDKTLGVWLSGVELALGEFTKLDHLPHRILLCGGGASLDMLVEALEQQDWYKDLPFTRKPAIQHLEPDEVVGIIDTTNKANDHTFITAMGLLRVGLDTIGPSGTSSKTSIRQKINKMLRV